MIGIEFDKNIKEFRKKLLYNYNIFTGISGKNIIRLLPPISLNINEIEEFMNKFKQALNKE